MRPSGQVGGSSQPAYKKVYSVLSSLHVAGIKSYARSRHELVEELGYDPRRDEIFIRAHTRKTGVPTAQAETLIKQPEEAAELHPELKEKTIQGDFCAHIFGEKEPREGVRKLCLGPTPKNVGTHGTKAKPPTKLAMEIQFCRQDEQVCTLLERTEQMQQQIGEMHQVLFLQGIRNVETPLPNNSVSWPMLSGIVAQDGKGELLISMTFVKSHQGQMVESTKSTS